MALFRNIFLIITSSLLMWTAHAQEATTTTTTNPSPLTFSMNSRFRFEDSDQKDLVNRAQFSSIRLRPQIKYELPDDSHIVLEGQYAKILGNMTYVPSGAAANTNTETSGNTSYNGDSMNVRQAMLDLHIVDGLHFFLGRQALSYGDEYIIGPSDWGVYGRSFDALRARWSMDKSWIDVFQAKVAEVNSSNQTAGDDKDLNGVYASFNSDTIAKTVELYYITLNDGRRSTATPADTTRPLDYGAYGVRYILDMQPIAWKLEYAKEFGKDNTSAYTNDKSNDMLDTDLGYQMDDTFKNRISVEYFYGGANWRDLYPTTNWQLGRTDNFGRRNLTGVAVHHRAAWSDKWNTDIDVFKYERTSAATTAFLNDSRTAVGAGTSTSKDLGIEEDVVVRYLQNKNLTWSLGLCFLQSGTYIKDDSRAKNPHYGFLMAESKF